jgi:hypothetical protein
MIFSDPQCGSIPDSKPAISFKRINLQTRNPDGTTGDLILSTEKIFSFGVCENTNMETGKVNGYVLPLCLYNKDCPSQSEKEWVITFNNIVDRIKKHLIDNRDAIEQEDLDERDLKKLNPLYYKKEKGKVVENSGPTLYAKLIMSKKLNKIMTMFYNPSTDQEIDPLELIGKFGFAKSAIKFESIFIGNKISLQIKIHECEFEVQQVGLKRLLSSRPISKPDVIIQNPLIAGSDTSALCGGSLKSDSDSESGEESEEEFTKATIKSDSGDKPSLPTSANTIRVVPKKIQAPVKKK